TVVNSKTITSHKVELKSALILPGIEYHFSVKSTDKAGNTATSSDMTFRTKGATLAVTVLNKKDSKPVEGATVTFAGSSGTTDSQGKTTLNDLPLGKHVGSISFKGKDSVGTVDITKINPDGAPQSVSFSIETPKTFPW